VAAKVITIDAHQLASPKDLNKAVMIALGFPDVIERDWGALLKYMMNLEDTKEMTRLGVGEGDTVTIFVENAHVVRSQARHQYDRLLWWWAHMNYYRVMSRKTVHLCLAFSE
jgi:hypothetical protein